MSITLVKPSATSFTFGDLALTAARTLGREWTAINVQAPAGASDNPVTLVHLTTGTEIELRAVPDVFGDYTTIELDAVHRDEFLTEYIETEETDTLGDLARTLTSRATTSLRVLSTTTA